ncbi:hypothetical protein POM88_047139 [Heracleum sosnowskyi]|uniref:chalcone synthase n=1 Tax=Heracleum sosnowskyi TaxID=360622 RepID=A0AAD8HAT9_9APIA|nr:hypothetical protein POM88_047139 [Heracleum sosnowskyi]
MVTMSEFRKTQRGEGLAIVLAIGTATPRNCVNQSMYLEYYFRVTNSEIKTQLKEKFKRMCDKSMVNTRYMHLTKGGGTAKAVDNIMATQGKKRGKTLFSFFKPSAATPTNEVHSPSNIDIEENPSSVDIEENQCDQPICKSPRIKIDLNTLERDPGIRKPIWQHPVNQ